MDYTEYAFMDPSEAGSANEVETGAHQLMDYDNAKSVVSRTYESPVQWYFVVWKPFNRAYEKDPDFFRVKGLDKCRQMFKKPNAYVVTRETESTKVHINAVVATSQPLDAKHETSYCNKYKVHVQRLSTLGDRLDVLSYITKENRDRSFTKYLDYLISK